ncbi:MAG: cytochrome ubiquinol oxidase subunit I [Vicinamibacterales bacterium]
MNYPIWELPGSGLLIAFVAVVHVVVSHFAVGGGLFLVLAERKARLEGDQELLGYVKRHSRFFILLTLVVGAITGVGIWFTVGLVHPQATSSLINAFVWAWAIEWTFFVTEIAAAMVYYHGWDRLLPRVHMRVGWIYFWSAWLSLVAISGILSFMLTPGGWLETRSFWQGLVNPTFLPTVAARTAVAVGLAGLYALVTVAWSGRPDTKARVARYAGLKWVVPMAVALPVTITWFLWAASGAGVPVSGVLGARADSIGALIQSLAAAPQTGHPIAHRAAQVVFAASLTSLLLTLFIALVRPRGFGPPLALAASLAAFIAIGAGEWVREDLRKPFVIGRYMFVNGVRVAEPPISVVPTAEVAGLVGSDRYTVRALTESGVLAASAWARTPPPGSAGVGRSRAEGEQVFKILCSSCHTVDGYVAMRPLVAGMSVGAIEHVVERLAVPVDAAAQPAAWAPRVEHRSWRGRRMPPFAGTPEERHALAVYLAILGGATPESVAAPPPEGGDVGKQYFEENCSSCHDPGGDMAIRPKGRTAETFYEVLGRLPSINELMPAFEGTDDLRRALAAHLAGLSEPDAPGAVAKESSR